MKLRKPDNRWTHWTRLMGSGLFQLNATDPKMSSRHSDPLQFRLRLASDNRTVQLCIQQ